jgi:hydrogenase expression/formation protein HypE
MAALSISCPVPIGRYDRVVLGHGSGGRLTADLVERLFVPAFHNDVLAALEDQATLKVGPGDRVAMTTDAFVVRPIFFPGGDIGRLAVCGTVNDLVVGGATARFLTAAFILEEGMVLADLERIVASMRAACDEAGVTLVAGDTKVVERGKGDQVFITTTGLGIYPPHRAGRAPLSVASARPGDRVLVSGTLGDHGIAILSVREGLAFDTVLESDVAPLGQVASAILDAAPDTRCMRDPTRGGLASTLNEIAAASRVGVVVDERAVPVRPAVAGACELLGLDAMYVANEGKIVAVVPAADADHVLAALRALPRGRDAAVVGAIVDAHPGMVTVRSPIGGERVLPMLAGEQLPRIC